MNQKHLLYAVLIALVAALLIQAQAPQRAGQSPNVQAGRFQIYSLIYSGSTGTAMTQWPDVFRIDAETGTTWRFSSTISNGVLTEKWLKIAEPQ
jgi:hypothetical protein